MVSDHEFPFRSAVKPTKHICALTPAVYMTAYVSQNMVLLPGADALDTSVFSADLRLDPNISLSSKIRLMRSLVTSIYLYACESWTLTADIQRRI